MEGFNLFQEKIKGEVKASALPDSPILFLQQDVSLNADLLDFANSRCSAISYQSLNQNMIPEFFESEIETYFSETSVDIKIEFCDVTSQQAPQLEDLRYTFFNYNNDLPSSDKKKVIMLFD
jgi:hypothetical protein